ncbi:hypothetical protein HMPREF9120_01075 [Neisseria sp. oral taxon 020 str. F0370]|nr:hypothetical protein HMPREF9120_01075 [Neisseria sp. oral taxon 020 str. F0370]
MLFCKFSQLFRIISYKYVKFTLNYVKTNLSGFISIFVHLYQINAFW